MYRNSHNVHQTSVQIQLNLFQIFLNLTSRLTILLCLFSFQKLVTNVVKTNTQVLTKLDYSQRYS